MSTRARSHATAGAWTYARAPEAWTHIGRDQWHRAASRAAVEYPPIDAYPGDVLGACAPAAAVRAPLLPQDACEPLALT